MLGDRLSAESSNQTVDKFRSDLRAGKVTAPVLVVHGDEDTVVPITLGERLYAMIQAPKHFVRVAGGGHSDLGARAEAAAKRFVAESREKPHRDEPIMPRALIPGLRRRDPYPSLAVPIVMSWAVMRGVVSLAAALALPDNFLGRDFVLATIRGYHRPDSRGDLGAADPHFRSKRLHTTATENSVRGGSSSSNGSGTTRRSGETIRR